MSSFLYLKVATHQASTGLGDKPRVFSSGDRLLQHEDMGTGHNDNFLSSLKKFP